MRKLNNCLILISLLFFLMTMDAFGDVYVFPVIPGTPEWNALSYSERIAAQQIPADFLETMSTSDLYYSFLNLPARFIVTGYFSNFQGFDIIREEYNVVSELMNKDDVGEVVVPIYFDYIIADSTIAIDITDSTQTNFYFQLDVLVTQLVLSQFEVLEELSPDEKKTTVQKALEIKQVTKTLYPTHVTIINNSDITLSLIGRLLLVDEYPPLMERIAQNPNIESVLRGEGFFYGYQGILEKDDVISMASDYISDITSVSEGDTALLFALQQPSPNPFNPTTTIEYSIPQDNQVTLSIYNVSGQLVTVLKDEYQQAGNYTITWDSNGLPSGLYFCNLKAGGFTETRKMVLVK